MMRRSTCFHSYKASAGQLIAPLQKVGADQFVRDDDSACSVHGMDLQDRMGQIYADPNDGDQITRALVQSGWR